MTLKIALPILSLSKILSEKAEFVVTRKKIKLRKSFIMNYVRVSVEQSLYFLSFLIDILLLVLSLLPALRKSSISVKNQCYF